MQFLLLSFLFPAVFNWGNKWIMLSSGSHSSKWRYLSTHRREDFIWWGCQRHDVTHVLMWDEWSLWTLCIPGIILTPCPAPVAPAPAAYPPPAPAPPPPAPLVLLLLLHLFLLFLLLLLLLLRLILLFLLLHLLLILLLPLNLLETLCIPGTASSSFKSKAFAYVWFICYFWPRKGWGPKFRENPLSLVH